MKKHTGWAPTQHSKTSFYLHAYYWVEVSPSEWVDNVGCVDIKDWEVRENLITSGQRELLFNAYCGAGEERGRLWLCSFPLDPRNRFYIVENDPKKCQRPNGDIVWRWDGSQIIDSRKKTAA